MDYPIWALSGRFCGKVMDNQVYNENGHHVGYIDGGIIFWIGYTYLDNKNKGL